MAKIYRAHRGIDIRDEAFVDDVMQYLKTTHDHRGTEAPLRHGAKVIWSHQPTGSIYSAAPAVTVYDTPMGAGSSVVRVELMGIIDWYFCDNLLDLQHLLAEFSL